MSLRVHLPKTHANEAEHGDIGARHVRLEPHFAVGQHHQAHDNDKQHEQADNDEHPLVFAQEDRLRGEKVHGRAPPNSESYDCPDEVCGTPVPVRAARLCLRG